MKQHEEDFREWYEKRSGKRLTDEEVKECIERVVRFMEILAEWGQKKKTQEDSNQ